MAPVLSQSEIQEITRLLEQGKALPEKYRDVLFVEQQLHSEDSTPANPERTALAERPADPTQPESNEMNSAAAFVKFLLDDPVVEAQIRNYEGMIAARNNRPYSRYALKDYATSCVNAIRGRVPEIVRQQAETGERLSRRTREDGLTEESAKELFSVIISRLSDQESEKMRAKRIKDEAEENEAVEGLLAKHADIVTTFLAIAERKVSVLDEYGDERLYLLGNLIDDCVAKIAGREGKGELLVKTALKKGGLYLHKQRDKLKELLRVREKMPAIFAKVG
jgi:hypothetical protein